MHDLIQFIADPHVQAALLGLLFALSEVLALIPGVKSNGVFELIVGLLPKK